MAKDLPYFKFFCSEWSDGDVTLEDYNVQGLFINICAYYWSNECDLSLSKLKKRFRNESETIDLLIKNSLIKTDNDIVSISFLDEQKEDREQGSKVKSRAGKASAEAKRLAKLQQELNTASTESQQTVNTTSTENQQVLNLCSTESQLLREEERREEKKRKDKIKVFTPPSLLEVENYFLENGYGKELAKKAFNHYDVADWHDSNGKKVNSWKQKLNTNWFKEENKIKPAAKNVITFANPII